MKIEVNTKVKLVKLDTLKNGDVFTVNDDFFMKTDSSRFNVINLKDGQLKVFYHDALVTPIDAALKVLV